MVAASSAHINAELAQHARLLDEVFKEGNIAENLGDQLRTSVRQMKPKTRREIQIHARGWLLSPLGSIGGRSFTRTSMNNVSEHIGPIDVAFSVALMGEPVHRVENVIERVFQIESSAPAQITSAQLILESPSAPFEPTTNPVRIIDLEVAFFAAEETPGSGPRPIQWIARQEATECSIVLRALARERSLSALVSPSRVDDLTLGIIREL